MKENQKESSITQDSNAETKKFAMMPLNHQTCENSNYKKGFQNQISIQSEDVDENLELQVYPDLRHRITSRELIFRSKFKMGTRNSLRISTKMENLSGNLEVNQNPDNILSINCLSAEIPYSPKQAESDCFLAKNGLSLSGSRDTNFCTASASTMVNSQNILPGRLTGNDEIILAAESTIRVVRQYSSSNGDQINIGNEPVNQAHVALEVANNQPSQPESAAANHIILPPELENTIYLNRILVLFYTLALSSMALILIIHENISIWALFVIFYGYWLYVIVNNLKGAYNLQRDPSKRKKDFYRALDGLSAILAQICLNLKMVNVIPFSFGAWIPFMITAIISCFINYNTRRFKSAFLKVSVKFVYTIQILLITLKLDGALDWDWIFVFGVVCVYFGVVCFCMVINFLSLIIHGLLTLFQQYRESIGNCTIISFGLFWYCIYYSLAFLGILFCFGFDEMFQSDKNHYFLLNVAWAGLFMNLFLMMYTKVLFKHLEEFLQGDGWSPGNGYDAFNGLKKSCKISFVKEKKHNYFHMISPTYFLTLNEFLKNKRRKSQENKQKSSNTRTKSDSSPIHISKEQLQEQKKILDNKFKSIAKMKPCRDSIRKQDIRLAKSLTEVDQSKTNQICLTKKYDSQTELDHSFTENNLSERENLCYICFQKAADTILMDCGHGGVCYECATGSIQKKNSCFTCRVKVEGICQISLSLREKNIIKSTEYTKVIQA